MSQTKDVDVTDRNTKFDKTVTIIAYLDESRYGNVRAWADYFDDTTDYYKRRTSESVTRKLVIGNFEKVIYGKDEFDELSKMDIGEGELVEEKTVKRKWSNSPGSATEKLIIQILDDVDVPDVLFDEFKLANRGCDWWNDDWDRVVTIDNYADEYKMLKEPDEFDEDDPYVGEEEFPALKIRIRISDVTRGQLQTIQTEIIDPVVDMLELHEDIDAVRFTDCETSEKGACFRI